LQQTHQQLKEERGLDHFEGHSWPGLHRHALMTMIAYAFATPPRTREVEKKNQRTSASAKLTGGTPRHHRSHSVTAISAMPLLLPATNP
jgi:SRSO17 transposase